MQELTYKQAGVNIEEGARAVDAIKPLVRSTYTPEVIGDLGGFGGMFSAQAFKDMDDPILISGTDGVGTKVELARRLGDYSTIGIDLVAMCVNDIVVSGARPLFFLDYMAVGKLNADFAAEFVGGIARGCKQAGCALIGGEMAEHPGSMADGDFDASGFCVGVVDRHLMIGSHRVHQGDVILGLPSSGLHSNGYSLVRRAYSDKLSDEQLALPLVDENSLSIAASLLKPTVIYARPLLDALALGCKIHAAAHITGGGITENLNRCLPKGTVAEIVLGSWQVPAIIDKVCDAANLSMDEALKTFNMGIGMALVCDASDVAKITQHFMGCGKVYRIGEVVANEDLCQDSQVRYKLKDGHRLAD